MPQYLVIRLWIPPCTLTLAETLLVLCVRSLWRPLLLYVRQIQLWILRLSSWVSTTWVLTACASVATGSSRVEVVNSSILIVLTTDQGTIPVWTTICGEEDLRYGIWLWWQQRLLQQIHLQWWFEWTVPMILLKIWIGLCMTLALKTFWMFGRLWKQR